MSDTSRENLSCLMDDELDRRGRKFLLRRLAGDAELTATWTRMHTVRACLQGGERPVARLMRLHIPVDGGVHDLPDAVEVRLAVRRARQLIRCCVLGFGNILRDPECADCGSRSGYCEKQFQLCLHVNLNLSCC